MMASGIFLVAQLQHSCSQTRVYGPELGLHIRGKLLNLNNRTWAGQNC